MKPAKPKLVHKSIEGLITFNSTGLSGLRHAKKLFAYLLVPRSSVVQE